VKHDLAREIGDSLRGLFAEERIAGDLNSVIAEASKSAEFARLVLLAGCTRDLEQTALIMAAMLLVGMRIARNRHEVDMLERMYGGGAA
jgi:hypothetical protein